MNPNTALRELRAALAGFDNDRDNPAIDWPERLREAAGALDGWLSKGGSLPDAWQANRTPHGS